MTDADQQILLKTLGNLKPLANIPPGTTLTFTGNAALHKDMGTSLGNDVGKLLGSAFILMITVLVIFFYHARYTLLSIISVLNGLLMTFGIMGLFDISLSIATMGALPASQEELNRVLAFIPTEKQRPYLESTLHAIISFGMVRITLDMEHSLTEQVSRDIAFYQPPPGGEVVVTVITMVFILFAQLSPCLR